MGREAGVLQTRETGLGIGQALVLPGFRIVVRQAGDGGCTLAITPQNGSVPRFDLCPKTGDKVLTLQAV